MFETVQNMALIIFGLFLILILLFVLRIVHAQTDKLRDMEARMKMMDSIEAPEPEKSKVTYKEKN